MESLHERLTRPGRRQTGNANVCPEDDDLPAFLMKLTHEELAALKDAIQQRRTQTKAAAHVLLYTIHAYKGLEARWCGWRATSTARASPTCTTSL